MVKTTSTLSDRTIDEYVEKTSDYSERIKEQYRVVVLNLVEYWLLTVFNGG